MVHFQLPFLRVFFFDFFSSYEYMLLPGTREKRRLTCLSRVQTVIYIYGPSGGGCGGGRCTYMVIGVIVVLVGVRVKDKS